MNVTIPNTVTFIDYAVFFNCSTLNTITLSENLHAINASLFEGCSNLANIVIPNSVTSIGEYAFGKCSTLADVTIPNSVISIGKFAFVMCNGLTSIMIPGSVTSIGFGVFGSCENLSAIEVAAENNHYCAIDGVLLNKTQDLLVQFPMGKPVTVYTTPNTVTTIEENAFQYCTGLTSVTMPSVSEIRDDAFSECSNLTSVHLSNYITSIGKRAFENCSALTQIIIAATTPPMVASNTFLKVPKNILVYVPCQSVEVYQTAEGWSGFANIIGSGEASIVVESNNIEMGTAEIVDASCEEGTAIIQAIPAENHRFVQWQDGNTENPRTVLLAENATFIATFELITGISKFTTTPYQVYIHHNTLTIKHAEGQAIAIFDMIGRCIFQTTATEESTFNLPTAGMYVVRAGESFVRKVIIN